MTEPAHEFRLRWKGQQSGPFTLEEIREKLSANEISLMHQIEVNGRWQVLEEFLARQQGRGAPQETQLANHAEEVAPKRAAADVIEGDFIDLTLERRVRLSPLAMAALGMALCNFIPYVNYGAWLLALFFGHIALWQMKHDDRIGGRALAIAALVLTYFLLLMALTFIVLMVADRQPLPFFSRDNIR